jgi:hypothetical protein
MTIQLSTEEIRTAWRGQVGAGMPSLGASVLTACFPAAISFVMTGLASDFSQEVLWAHAAILVVWVALLATNYALERRSASSHGVSKQKLDTWRYVLYIAVVSLLLLTFANMFTWGAFLSLRRDGDVPVQTLQAVHWGLIGVMAVGGIIILANGSRASRMIYFDRFDMRDSPHTAQRIYQVSLGFLLAIIFAWIGVLINAGGEVFAIALHAMFITIGLLCFTMAVATAYQAFVLLWQKPSRESLPDSAE